MVYDPFEPGGPDDDFVSWGNYVPGEGFVVKGEDPLVDPLNPGAAIQPVDQHQDGEDGDEPEQRMHDKPEHRSQHDDQQSEQHGP